MTFPTPLSIRQWQHLLLALLILMCFSLPAKAADPIGDILFVHGTVEIIDVSGHQRLAAKGDKVFKGDRIVAKDASSLQIQMTDKGYFAVRPNSVISLDDYQFKNSDQDRVNTSIIRGGLRSITGAIGQKNKKAFLVRTPVATIGIRGTDLTAFYITSDMATSALGQQGSYLAIESGGGFLQNSAGMQILQSGQTAFTASATAIPVSISQLPGIFSLPTFEQLIPGVNDLSDQDNNQPAEESKEEVEEQAKKDEKQKGAKQDDKEENKFSFNAHAYLGVGNSDHFLHNYDLADISYAPMFALQKTPYESSGDIRNFAAGIGTNYQFSGLLEAYANVEFRTTAIDTGINIEATDTNTDISGGKVNVGAKLNISDVLKVWANIQHAGYSNNNESFYNGYDLYQRNTGYSNYYAANYGGLKLAAAPGYEGDRFQLGASLDVGPLVGVFGSIQANKNQWDSYYSDHYYDGDQYRYDLRHIRSGLYTNLAEAGVRFNPILIPIDFYASALAGSFGSDGDDYHQHYDGDLRGLRGKAIFNDNGIVSAYFNLTLLQLEGNGDQNWYDSGLGYETQKNFKIDQTIRNVAMGAELQITKHVKIQALAQHINSRSDIETSQYEDDEQDSLATELRLKVEL